MTFRLTWDDLDRLIQSIAIAQLAAAVALAFCLMRGWRQSGRLAVRCMAVGLVGISLAGAIMGPVVGAVPAGLALRAFALFPAAGVVALLSERRRHSRFWLAMATLVAVIMQVTLGLGEMILLARSM
jgi:hypothetical protein